MLLNDGAGHEARPMERGRVFGSEAAEEIIETLRRREQMKDAFLATLAHELRSPLAPIRNAADVLATAGLDEPTLARTCEVIRRQVRILSRLVDDLLDLSRTIRGGVELRREPIDMAAVIATSVETVKPLVQHCGHELVVRVREVPLVVEGDAARLTQVLVNLLNNAAKYTPPGGRIVVAAAPTGQQRIAVRVRDNGIGIPCEHLGRIFDLFAQVDPASPHTMGGLGVGLALARQLAERHGGSLHAFSAGPGRGSAFTLVLPSSPSRAAVASGTLPATLPRPR